jgi:hypothetical protein
MSLPPRDWVFRVHLLMLHYASMLVPAARRREWQKEWAAEVWYVWQAAKAGPGASLGGWLEVSAFCRGAWSDAFWLRRDTPWQVTRTLASPGGCILFLTAIVAVNLLVALQFPDTRNALVPDPHQNATTTVLISRQGLAEVQVPTIRLEEYEQWRATTHKFFTKLAFYEPVKKRVRVTGDSTVELSIARATANLFDLIDTPAVLRAHIASNSGKALRLPALVLSRSVWQDHFGADRNIVGHVLKIGGEDVMIAGVMPDTYWRLPAHLDALLLYDDQGIAKLPRHSKGFVLARWRPSALAPGANGRWRWNIPSGDGRYDSFDCMSLAQRSRAALSRFLLTLILAVLALPAMTPLALGDYPGGGARRRWVCLRRWTFLIVKIALVIPASYFVSLNFGHFLPGAQIPVSFAALLFALRWVLRDQRNRCPVCLRVLTNPARVGQPSWNFLAWNGTELICEAGHGLLHVPELSTSWFSTQRWLYLDSSWECLFPATLV